MEETRLNKINNLQQSQSDFPPQYNLPKLTAIFLGNEVKFKLLSSTNRRLANYLSYVLCIYVNEMRQKFIQAMESFKLRKKFQAPWNEYIHFETIRKKQKAAATEWLKDCFRYAPAEKNAHSQMQQLIEINPMDDILKHLQTYDPPMPTHDFQVEMPLIENFSHWDLPKKVLPILKKKFKMLDEAAR